MRAGLFRCFVCGKVATVIADVTPIQTLPGPNGWRLSTTWLQNNETGIVAQLAVPFCEACPGPPDRFVQLSLAALTFFISGAVLQSAPCRPADGSSGSGPGPSSLPS